jgi:hypothetical protein
MPDEKDAIVNFVIESIPVGGVPHFKGVPLVPLRRRKPLAEAAGALEKKIDCVGPYDDCTTAAIGRRV